MADGASRSAAGALIGTITGALAGAAVASAAVKAVERRHVVPRRSRPPALTPAVDLVAEEREASLRRRSLVRAGGPPVAPPAVPVLPPEPVPVEVPARPRRIEPGGLVAPSEDVRARTQRAVDSHERGAARRMKIGFTLGVVATVLALQLVRWVLWADGFVPRRWYDVLLSYGAWTWVFPIVPVVFALIGFYRFERLPAPSWSDDRRDPLYRPCPHEVCYRVVSRGTNPGALSATVDTIYAEMAALPLFPWSVEVVTDIDPGLEPRPGLVVLVVPEDYATAEGSLYKARALNYALDTSAHEDTTWLMHLDEESRITPSLVRGIRDAVLEEEESGQLRIGQGAILYHGHLEAHTNLTLADMIRSGEDLGRFHLQHRLGVTLFGLHGSFILVRSDVEKQVSFDVGPEGSITEDAFWALRQMAVGQRIRWVEGFLSEQSPQSITDFVKQRRRWFSGLNRCVLYADAPWWARLPLAVNMAFWSVSWVSMAYTIMNLLLLGYRTPAPIAVLGDIAFASYAMFYATGLWLNLRDRGGVSRKERISLYATLIVLFPAYNLIEAMGVVMGIFRPVSSFHVVQKEEAKG